MDQVEAHEAIATAEQELQAICQEHGIPQDGTHRTMLSLLISMLLGNGVAVEGIVCYVRGLATALEAMQAGAKGRTCRECGCTDYKPCRKGCKWVEQDLCSACVEKS